MSGSRRRPWSATTGLLLLGGSRPSRVCLASGLPWGRRVRRTDPSADSHDVSARRAWWPPLRQGRGGGHRLAGRPAPCRRRLLSGLSGLMVLGTGLNLASRSPAERLLWAPVAALTAVSAWQARPGGQLNAYKRGDRQVGAVCGADGGQVVDLVRRAVASSLTSSAPTRSRPAAVRRAGMEPRTAGAAASASGRVAIPLYEERSESSTIPPAGVVLVSLQLDDAVATTHVRPEVRGPRAGERAAQAGSNIKECHAPITADGHRRSIYRHLDTGAGPGRPDHPGGSTEVTVGTATVSSPRTSRTSPASPSIR